MHVRRRLSEGLLDGFSGILDARSISVAGYFELARPEIERAFEILGPALMVDFMEQHPDLIDTETLEIWARIDDKDGGSENDGG